MNRAMIDKIAAALLYEGYILYPYRPSVKNRQRWTFGGIYPQAWCDAQDSNDAWWMQTQVLARAGRDATLEGAIRFLHLIDRTVGKFRATLTQMPSDIEPAFESVELLEVGDRRYQPWQEAAERELSLGFITLGELLDHPREMNFDFPSQRNTELVRSPDGPAVGILIRQQQAISAAVELSALDLGGGLLRITARIVNQTPLNLEHPRRDDALMRSLVSTHTILGLQNGEFVSLTDAPERWSAQAAACQNVGCWPVLVGDEPERDAILSSPIVLGDYPQIAPESPGDLFDATEIDEILTLRIMTLTDDEKRVACGVDQRVRDLLSRTQSLEREQFIGLHGTVRGLRPVAPEQSHE